MQILDFFCQGVGPFKNLFKLNTEGRSVAVEGPGGSGKSIIARAILAVLYPEYYRRIKDSLYAEGSEVSRLALTFRTGGEIYRIIRDLNKDSVQLMKYEKDEKKFSPYTSDEDQISLLATDWRLPDLKTYLKLFFLDGSRIEDVFAEAAPVKAETSVQETSLESFPGERSGAGEDRVALLRAELEKAEEIRKLEFELDDLERRLFEMEDKKRKAAGLQERIEGLRNELERYKSIEHLPPDIHEKVKTYNSDQEKLALKLRNFDDRINELEARKLVLEGNVLWKDNKFIAGIILLIGGALGFFFTPGEGSFRILKNLLPLLSVGGLALGVFSAWKFLSGSESLRAITEELEKLRRERRKQESTFEMEYAIIPQIMKEFNLNFPEEIMEIVERKKELEQELQELEASIASSNGETGLEALEEEEQTLRQRISEIKERLKELGPLMAAEEEIRDELEALETGAGLLEAPGVLEVSGGGVPAGTLMLEDAFQNLFHRDFPSFVFENAEMIGRFLKASSGGRWEGVDYGTALLLKGTQGTLPAAYASTAEKAALLLSIILTVRVWGRESCPVPLILDCPEAPFSSKELPFVARLLGEMSRRIQMLLFYRNANFEPPFEKRIALK